MFLYGKIIFNLSTNFHLFNFQTSMPKKLIFSNISTLKDLKNNKKIMKIIWTQVIAIISIWSKFRESIVIPL